VTGTTRALIEKTYGKLGTGAEAIFIRNQVVLADEVLAQMGILFEGTPTIDCGTLAPNRHYVRFYDNEDRHIVVIEFDNDLQLLVEHHSHLAEWIGEEEYFNIPWYASCPVSF